MWILLVPAIPGFCAQADVEARPDAGASSNVEAPLALDPVRSTAEFEVKVLWLIGVHGRFGKVHGTIAVDREHASVVADARIDVGTITMRTRSYEEWVKSAEFFDAAKFPQIHFVSEAFPQDRLRSGGEIAGTLTVRDVNRHIVLEVEPSDCPDAVARRCAVEASGRIHRSDFGMRSRRGTLSDNVELRFSILLAPNGGNEAASQ
ncbi:MAG TPA: YceI family protein [Rudaea sp.]|nr:YceI family protein [Rudaea sp.]